MRRQALWSVLGAAGMAALLLPPRAGADVAVIVIDGRGFGHGVGMAQDGAERMGRLGANTNQILGQFYPGTALAKASGQLRVVIAGDPHGDATLGFPSGGQVRDALNGAQSPGFPVSVSPGGSVQVHYDGNTYTVSGPAAATAAASRPAAASLAGDGARLAATGSAPAAAAPTTTTSLVPPPPSLPGPTSTVPRQPGPGSTTTTASPGPTTTAPPAGGGPGPPGSPAPGPPGSPAPGSPAPGTPAPAPTASSSRPLWAVPAGANGVVAVGDGSHRYRGVTEAEGLAPAPPSGPVLQLVNQLDVEQYLRGMGEVLDPRWPPASLRVQAIAARTYGLRAMESGGEICATDRCQVYLGQQAEYPAMDRAVAETAGQVLVFRRALASTVYSANGGGISATRAEGFGPSEAGSDAAYPYLRAAPYPTGDPMPWTVTVGLGDLATRLGYTGQLSGIRVSQTGPSGRALEVTLDGSAGPRAVAGVAFASALGLRSTLFTTRLGSAAAASPPPPPSQAQAPPEQAAAIAAAPAGLLAGDGATRPASLPGRRGTRAGLPVWPGIAVVASGLLAAAAALAATPRGRALWDRVRGG
ncbi:MAG TPA: SpoIID/LytB domain-containing protein [Acidimicrobiales bacterium]|nr:SpoIID/LytB domain-containing protein [Acidimicrobiales bacterium]